MRAPPVEVPAWLRTSAALGWRFLVLVAVVAVVGWILIEIAIVSFPVAMAAILTTLLIPPANWLERRGLSRRLATVIVVVGGILAIVGLTALIVTQFVAAAPELGESLSKAYDRVLGWLQSVGLSPDELRTMIRDAVRGGGGGEGGGGGAASSVLSGTRTVVEFIAGFLLMLVTLFFFVKDRGEIVQWFHDRTPERYREVGSRLAGRTWDVLTRYLRGVAVIATVDAVAIAVGLLLIGVPLVLPLAVLVFLGGFVPVVGATVAGLVATLVALVSGGLVDAALTLGVVVLVQQVEGNVLQPIVMGREVPLHPVVVLVAVTAGAALFSVAGAIIAVPLAGVASAVGNELRLMNAEGPGEPRAGGATAGA